MLLLLAVAATWYNVSSGWIAELTIYSIYADMNQFGPEAFRGFSRAYLSHLPISILPVGVMILAWSLLLWLPCRGVPLRNIWLVIALCTAFVAVTPLAAAAQDQMYNEGFSPEMYSRLMWSNGVRAVISPSRKLLRCASSTSSASPVGAQTPNLSLNADARRRAFARASVAG